MPTTVTSLEDRTNILEEKVDSLQDQVHLQETDFSSFKSRIDTAIALMRWIGIFVAGLTVTVIASVISFAFSAGKLDSNIDRLKDASVQQEKVYQKQLDGLKEVLQQQEKMYQKQDETIRRIEIKMTEISTKLSSIEEKLKK